MATSDTAAHRKKVLWSDVFSAARSGSLGAQRGAIKAQGPQKFVKDDAKESRKGVCSNTGVVVQAQICAQISAQGAASPECKVLFPLG